jgi:hypothetical protein
VDEGEILNGLRTKISKGGPQPNLFSPKNGLDNGVHLIPLLLNALIIMWMYFDIKSGIMLALEESEVNSIKTTLKSL